MNIINWLSIKCKRISNIVLASQLYAMIYELDLRAMIKSIIEYILAQSVLVILYMNLKSLYDCLVKLSTTQEKRLIVYIMCLRQSYERCKIIEMRWIDDNSNSVNGITKAKPCHVFQELLNTNIVNMKISGWVEEGIG